MQTFSADLEQGSKASDYTRPALSENLQNDSCRAAYDPNDEAQKNCFSQTSSDKVSFTIRGDSRYMEFGNAPGIIDDVLTGYFGGTRFRPDFNNIFDRQQRMPMRDRSGLSVDGHLMNTPVLGMQSGDNTAAVLEVGGGDNTAAMLRVQDTIVSAQKDVVREGEQTPVIERRDFHNLLVDNIYEAYFREGNNPRFWTTLQNLMSADMQRLVDQGKISAADKAAFDKSFMKDVKDVYSTHGNRPPAEFWQTLEDRVYNSIKTQRELPKPPRPDDNPDVPPNPQPSDKTVEGARTKFRDTIDNYLSPERVQRMDKMMKEFEQRGAERVEALVASGKDRATVEKEWNDKITKTYAELTELVASDSPSAVYDKPTRAKLAENAMYLIMNPTKENQGQHGTCWIESEINLVGLTNHPEKMADLLQQVATTGSYTDLQGRKYNVPKSLLQFTGEEANWTISNADNGLRSPVGAIFDRTLSYMGGRMDGGTNGGTPQEAETLIKKVCGEAARIVQIRDNYLTNSDIQRLTSGDLKKDMLEKGGVILIGPGHMFVAKLDKNQGQWQIVGDNQWGAKNDQLIGRVNDLRTWNVTPTRERFTPDHGSLAVSGDSPIGVKSYNSYQPGGYSYGYGYGVSVSVFARGDKGTRIYDDTNTAILGPLANADQNPLPSNKRADRQFHKKHYEDSLRRMEEARKRVVVIGK